MLGANRGASKGCLHMGRTRHSKSTNGKMTMRVSELMCENFPSLPNLRVGWGCPKVEHAKTNTVNFRTLRRSCWTRWAWMWGTNCWLQINRLSLRNNRSKSETLWKLLIIFRTLWNMPRLPYPHGQFGTQLSNNYFNYCKAIMQLQQYFNQLWAVV